MSRNKASQPVIIGGVLIAVLTLGLQYVQHSREDRLVTSAVKLEHATEFDRPAFADTGTLGAAAAARASERSAAALKENAVALDARLGKLEKALNWLETQPTEGIEAALAAQGGPTPHQLPHTRTAPGGGVDAMPGGLSAHLATYSTADRALGVGGGGGKEVGQMEKKRPKIDTTSSTKLAHRLHDTKKKEDKEVKKEAAKAKAKAETEILPLSTPSNKRSAGSSSSSSAPLVPRPAGPAAPDDPVLLQRVLEVVGVDDITNYPAWYFGAMGARGYFEHGPWATDADVNVTNDNYCAKARGKEGPWRALSKLKPTRGRKALVATVSRCAICDFIGTWDAYGKPPAKEGGLFEGGVVLIGGGNENWGMFSEYVTNRSVAWGAFSNKLKGCGKSVEDFQRFMDDPRILLWVTNQHQAMDAVHPKVLSLPLGMKNNPQRIYHDGMKKHAATKKKKLLIINNSGWKHRAGVNALVSAKFPGLAENAYAVGKAASGQELDYYAQLAEAKFVLCPSGMGYDTYRHWEVLLMGSIPVFESSPGFDKTFHRLPVLIVPSYDDITPALLEATYAKFTAHADELFDFHRLKKSYWMNLILGTAQKGTSAEVIKNHPPDQGTRVYK